MSANDGPNAQGFTGSNRVTGTWNSAGAQRGSCRAVMVSIFFGQVLALHVPVPEFEAALPAAIAWQLTRILPGGEVDVRGNTRTGVGKEKSPFDGKTKNVNYPEVIFALTYYGLVHHDEAALAAAERVFSYHQRTHSRGA
ncbi:MAG TPA: hypothetical protein VL069_07210 [Opitutus sp.]|nr:hypothetical protein [Opitutus sp.]